MALVLVQLIINWDILRVIFLLVTPKSQYLAKKGQINWAQNRKSHQSKTPEFQICQLESNQCSVHCFDFYTQKSPKLFSAETTQYCEQPILLLRRGLAERNYFARFHTSKKKEDLIMQLNIVRKCLVQHVNKKLIEYKNKI